jgi:hypothetical protein
MAPRKRDLATDDLKRLRDDVFALFNTLTKDPKKEARKQRAWGMLFGALSAGFAMAGRQAMNRAWPILTGETPPTRKGPPPEPPSGTRERELDEQRHVVRPDGTPGAAGDERQPADHAVVEGETQRAG